MLLSFVIPAYNVGEKIKMCLTSISRIPLSKEEYEIIIVDDFSMDNTISVAEDFLIKNKLCYSLLRQEKEGQASARNKGVKISKGKYIWMVDSDDEILPDPSIVDVLITDSNAELITFNYEEVWSNHSSVQHKFLEKRYVTGIDFLANSVGGSYLWNKIYRRDAVQNIKFIEGSTHIEDMCFNVHAIVTLKNILCLPIIGYRYYRYPKRKLMGENLITERMKANEDSLKAYQAIYELAVNSDQSAQDILYKILNFDTMAHLYSIFLNDNGVILKRYRDIYRSMGLYPFSKTTNIKANIFRIVINNPILTSILKFFFNANTVCR